MNLVYSEFLPLKLFWVLLQSKVPNKSHKVYGLDTQVKLACPIGRPEHDRKLFVKSLVDNFISFFHKESRISEAWLLKKFTLLITISIWENVSNFHD